MWRKLLACRVDNHVDACARHVTADFRPRLYPGVWSLML